MLRMGWLLLCVAVTACAGNDGPRQPAPIGDKAALERLAAEYEKLADNLPVSPWKLQPAQRKDFLERVFADAGYGYTATLHSMAAGGWSAEDQNAKDLAELLFMPHTNINASEGLKGVYSEEEMADVRKVQKMLP